MEPPQRLAVRPTEGTYGAHQLGVLERSYVRVKPRDFTQSVFIGSCSLPGCGAGSLDPYHFVNSVLVTVQHLEEFQALGLEVSVEPVEQTQEFVDRWRDADIDSIELVSPARTAVNARRRGRT
jgi:hypothetical protein